MRRSTRPEPISAPSSKASITEAGCIPRSATNPRLSSKPNSANSKPSERTQPKLCHSYPVSQPRAGESQMSMGDCAKDRNRFLRGSLIREALDGNADYDFARGSRSARFQRAVRMLGDVVHFARRDSVWGEILRGYS